MAVLKYASSFSSKAFIAMQLTVILINMQPIYYKNTLLSSGSGTDNKYLVYYLVRLKLAAHLKCTKLDPVNVVAFWL